MPEAPNSPTLAHVHVTHEGAATEEMSPPHAPRVETEAFKKTRHFLISEKGQGCAICGVTQATLTDSIKNPFAATQLEAHHSPIEYSLMDAVDPKKVHADYAEVYDRETLSAFVDSPRNMVILCDVHHRGVESGIHHLLTPDFWVQRYLWDGYKIAATKADATQVEATDERIEVAHGEEPAAA